MFRREFRLSFKLSEALQAFIVKEQEHEIDLAVALGINVRS